MDGGGDDDGYDDDSDDEEEEKDEEEEDDDDDDAGNLVSHVISGQHGQELTEEDGAKEQCEDPLMIMFKKILTLTVIAIAKNFTLSTFGK